jgi:hypothetical protein
MACCGSAAAGGLVEPYISKPVRCIYHLSSGSIVVYESLRAIKLKAALCTTMKVKEYLKKGGPKVGNSY